MPLERLFNKNGFTYTQIKRSENTAIYEQKKEGISQVYYEVIKIKKSKKDFHAPWGLVPEGTESYPGSEQWGTNGWTFKTIEQAEEKYNEIEKEEMLKV